MIQKITPFLWFEKDAEKAAKFYVDLFNGNPGMKVKSKLSGGGLEYDEASSKVSGQPKGSVMVVSVELEGQTFTLLNGGPQFPGFGGKMKAGAFNATSFIISCKTQQEVDYFWEKLSANGGEAGQCGWINHDKYGVTWQVVPDILDKLLGDPDPKKSERAMKAMLGMTKLDIAKLKAAHAGK